VLSQAWLGYGGIASTALFETWLGCIECVSAVGQILSRLAGNVFYGCV
jgi:hypothetical protein